MKLLSASFFLALGLAIGTTISALAGAGAAAGGRHVDVVSDATVKDLASVLERNETS